MTVPNTFITLFSVGNSDPHTRPVSVQLHRLATINAHAKVISLSDRSWTSKSKVSSSFDHLKGSDEEVNDLPINQDDEIEAFTMKQCSVDESTSVVIRVRDDINNKFSVIILYVIVFA